MRILHLSDTHLYGDDSLHYGRIDTTAALAGVLDPLRSLRESGADGAAARIDAVIHTGDASDDGSVGSYRRLHAQLEPFAAELGAQLVVAMGNHDAPAAYAEVAGEGAHGGPWQDRLVPLEGGGCVIVLDTSVPGAGYGHLDPEQLDWLRSVLPDAPEPAVLALHHPPLKAATPLLAALDLDGLEELGEILRGSAVRLILAGHFHHEMAGELAGIPVHVAPGVTNVVDPLGAVPDEQALALSGASLIEIGDAGGGGGRVGPLPRIVTAVWPNAGDRLGDVGVPVYRFDPEEGRRIIAAAGRPAAQAPPVPDAELPGPIV